MAQLQIVYWRDIPASVQVRAGRRDRATLELPVAFSEAIDTAAMRAGLAGTDDYLEQWRRSDPAEVGDDLQTEAQAAHDRLVAEYPRDRIVALAKNKGLEE